MKRDFSPALSEKALRAIRRETGLVKRKRRKHETKQRLREVKKAWRLFEQTCVDTSYLCDIPELRARAKVLGLPRYQYTAREVTLGQEILLLTSIFRRYIVRASLTIDIVLKGGGNVEKYHPKARILSQPRDHCCGSSA